SPIGLRIINSSLLPISKILRQNDVRLLTVQINYVCPDLDRNGEAMLAFVFFPHKKSGPHLSTNSLLSSLGWFIWTSGGKCKCESQKASCNFFIYLSFSIVSTNVPLLHYVKGSTDSYLGFCLLFGWFAYFTSVNRLSASAVTFIFAGLTSS